MSIEALRGQKAAMALYLSVYILLLTCFNLIIAPVYGSNGFEWAPSSFKILESLAIVLFVSYCLPVKIERPSDLLLHIHFLLPIVPMIVLYGASDLSRAGTFSVAALFLLIIYVRRIRIFSYVSIQLIRPANLMAVLIVGAGFIIATMIGFGGLSYWNLDLYKVYEVRDYSADNLPEIFGYIRPLAANVLIPVALLLSLLYKNKIITALSIASSVVLFGLSAHKGVLVYPAIVVALYYFMRFENIVASMLIWCLALLVSCLALYLLFGQPTIFGDIIVRRGFFIPSIANFWYFDFFTSNPHVFWADSKVSLGMLDSPYRAPVSRILGFEYFRTERANLNTGWIGSGFANAGYVGLLAYAVIVGLTLRYLDVVAFNVGLNLVTATAAVPVVTLFVSSDLPSTFFNHGMLLLFFIYTLFNVRGVPRRKPGYSVERSPAGNKPLRGRPRPQ